MYVLCVYWVCNNRKYRNEEAKILSMKNGPQNGGVRNRRVGVGSEKSLEF